MSSFKEFYLNSLQEKLITFGGKAYPKNGNVVILAGGSGSGKGAVIKNLLGIQGKIIDVDMLKTFALKSKTLQAKHPELKTIDLKNPADVHNVHQIISQKEKLDNKLVNTLLKSISTSTTELPNLIFDITLKDLSRLKEICAEMKNVGYQIQNIHLVWVLADVDTAMSQNSKRSRVVPQEILMKAHVGAANSMKQVIYEFEKMKGFMDGDVWIAFNKSGVDISFAKPKEKGKGNYIDKANYLKIKSQGQSLNSGAISPEVIQKISSYVPNGQF